MVVILGASFLALELVAPKDIRIYQPSESRRVRADYVAKSKIAMISSAHALATTAGNQILKEGGNAVDASIAVSFAISVLRPHSTGIGGGGFLLYYNKEKGLTEVFDFRERAPLAASRDMYLGRDGEPIDFVYMGHTIPNASVNGHMAGGIPGLVAGLADLHKKHGTLPWAKLLAPAINLAAEGFPVYPSLAFATSNRQEILKNFEDSRRIFLPNGKPIEEGQILVQKDLAWTLAQISQFGPDAFYKGEVSKRFIAEMTRGHGLISPRDLATYQVKMRKPLSGKYRGYTIVSMPPPSSGGIHIIQMLNMLENYDYGGMGHNTEKGVHVLSEVMRRAFADRAKYLGDPEFVNVPIMGLMNSDYAKKQISSLDMKHASSSSEVGAGDPAPYESPSTTHFSVVDSAGNAVSSTQTVNTYFGSCVVIQGAGFFLNNEMDDFSKKPGVPNAFGLLGSEANAIAAKKTMLSSMSPTLVFDQQDRLKLVVGSPGGPRIINATIQTIINVIDHGMELRDAVHAFRIHHQWYPDRIEVEEGGLEESVLKGLVDRGHQIFTGTSIGDVQAVGWENDGWTGVADTRSEGFAQGL